MGAKNSIQSKLIRPARIVFSKEDKFFQQRNDSVIASKSIVNIYITYKLSSKTISSSDALKNCLFGATKVKKPNNTTNPHKWQYRGYGADLSNSRHPTNKTQNVLVLGRDFGQKITTIYAEKLYSPNFSVENKTFVLSLHYNGDDSYLFVNGKEVTKFKAKAEF